MRSKWSLVKLSTVLVVAGAFGPALAPTVAAFSSRQAPAEFALAAAPLGNASTALHWSSVRGAASYDVYAARTLILDESLTVDLLEAPPSEPSPMRGAAPGTWTLVAEDVTGTTQVVSTLPEGSAYAFLVRALDADRRSFSQSTVAEVSLGSAPGGDLSVTVPAPGVVRLTWESVPGAVHYALHVGRPGTLLVPDPARQAMDSTAVHLEGLPVGSSWRFAVTALDEEGGMLARSMPAAEIVVPSPSLLPSALARLNASGPSGAPLHPSPWCSAWTPGGLC